MLFNRQTPRTLANGALLLLTLVLWSTSLVGCNSKPEGGAQPAQPEKPESPSECGVCKSNESCVGGQCVCTPQCENNACGDDGCGAKCACPEGYVTDADGNLVKPVDCHDTCATAQFACGSVCGENCGTCGEGQACEQGQCGCKPSCDGTSCSDGCGGLCDCSAGNVCNAQDSCVTPSACTDSCESTGRECGDICGQDCGQCGDGKSCVMGKCREALNCSDCALKFSLVSKIVESGHIREVVLAIDYDPADTEPRPRLADLRIEANRNVELLEVDEGNALTESGKKLFFDETSHRNWQKRPDGSYQLFAYGVSDVDTIVPGRVVTMTFKLDELGPVSFSLARRAQMFAPPGADQALQSSPYDQAVVVSR